MDSHINLYRKIRNSAVWQDPDLLRLWLLCLLKATHKPYQQLVGNQVVDLQPGQFVTGRDALAEEYNQDLPPRKRVKALTLWRWLQKLEKLGNLNIKSTNKFSIITIVNWAEYQQVEQQMNNNRTTNEQQMITNKNINNDDLSNDDDNKEFPHFGIEDKRLTEIRNHFSDKAGRIWFSHLEEKAMMDLLEEGIPVEIIKAGIDLAFERFKPRYKGHKIKSFNYCVDVIRELYEAEKRGGEQNASRKVRSGGNQKKDSGYPELSEGYYEQYADILFAK